MRIRDFSRAISLLVLANLGWASAEGAHRRPDSFVGRLEAFALIEQLNGELLASRSATMTLEAWCGDHHMANPAKLIAIPDRDANKPASPVDRLALEVGPDEVILYRHVRLSCGGHVLSEAENWYVPSRLTAGMNRQLETTDTPFGRAVQGLHPVRQTLSVERLWSPLPADWDRTPQSLPVPAASEGELAIPAFLFRHRALLFDTQRRPIALVVETYAGEALKFPR